MAKRGAKRQKTKQQEEVEEEQAVGDVMAVDQVSLREDADKKKTTVANQVGIETNHDHHNAQTSTFESEQDRQQWASRLRQKFTPKEMLKEDGTINHDWFKPKATRIKVRKWSGRERELLIKGIEQHGIGNWTAIRQESLPDWVSPLYITNFSLRTNNNKNNSNRKKTSCE